MDKYTKGEREEIWDGDRSEPWTSLSQCVSQTKALRQRLGLQLQHSIYLLLRKYIRGCNSQVGSNLSKVCLFGSLYFERW